MNHHWNIFVNPVGVDATVQQTATRCVAGGYIWNPFYTQLADPLNVRFNLLLKRFFFYRIYIFRLICTEKNVVQIIH